jgi:hypothetical protein
MVLTQMSVFIFTFVGCPGESNLGIDKVVRGWLILPQTREYIDWRWQFSCTSAQLAGVGGGRFSSFPLHSTPYTPGGYKEMSSIFADQYCPRI